MDAVASRTTEQIIDRFNRLYIHDRQRTLDELDKLDDFDTSDEFQQKIVFSVIVLSFRAVQQTIEQREVTFWQGVKNENINSEPSKKFQYENNVETLNLRCAFLRYLYSKARKSNFMKSNKDVTDQLWSTLYDFPMIKSCHQFKVFIQECVQTAWELQTLPSRPLNLDYVAGCPFDETKHVRFYTSNTTGSRVLKFVWPGLVENPLNGLVHSAKCLNRGVVIT